MGQGAEGRYAMTAIIEEPRTTVTAHTGRIRITGMPDVVWDVTDQASVDAARATFTKLTREKKMGAAVAAPPAPGQAEATYTKVTEFDPTAGVIMMWGQHQGG